MSVDFETVKSKIEEKLPKMLPKAVKWVIVHLLMLLYHFKMPVWVTALKASKSVRNFKNGKQGSEPPAVAESTSLRHERLRVRRDARRSRRDEMRY